MPAAGFVAGDWGTTNLRLFLCDATGQVLAETSGPGAAAARGQFEALFDSLVSPWWRQHGTMPTVLCGMVGSTIGWTQVPYVPCPARDGQIAAACHALRDGAIHIVPGASCRNRFGAPDFMRGEETQIIGALALNPSLARGRHLLCLPGTPTKWVVIAEGAIAEFLTAPAGEVFALLRDHSVLVGPRAISGSADAEAAFAQGVSEFNRLPEAQLLHRLFECRSRRLAGELAEPAAESFLSGLLIASDVTGALRAYSEVLDRGKVHLVGTPELTTRYAHALAARLTLSQAIDGAGAALAGLASIQMRLARGNLAHGR